MSSYGQPEFEIAALKQRQTAVWNPMAAGAGTPWEDRATHGTVGAFLKTCLASMTGPRKLVADIRRPETTGDARAFVIGCGLMWGLSAAGHTAFALHRRAQRPDVELVSVPLCVLYVAGALVGATVGIVLLWMLYSAVYNRLVAEETRRGVALPEPLLSTASGYAFGPSILAVIPLVGPPLALVVMLAVMVAVGGSQRLRLRFSAALIDAILGFVAIVAVGAAGSVVALYADKVLPEAVSIMDKTTQEANQPAIRSSSAR